MHEIANKYVPLALFVDRKDGISLSFKDWRFNIRQSNTEALIRLNVESMEDEALLIKKTQELSDLILANAL